MPCEATAIIESAPLKKRKNGILITACCLFIVGILSCFLWDKVLDYIIKQRITLRPGTKTYNYWKAPPFDINLDIYIFNWTNSQDFYNPAIKPIFEQLGPYRFTEIPNKVDIRWHPENDTVSYRKKSLFKFKPLESQGSLTDEIVTINPVAMSAANKAKSWNTMRRSIIDFALKYYNGDLTVKRTVDELLFTGYNDLLMDFVNTLPAAISKYDVPFDKFGYCYMRNDSSKLTGIFNINTGASDISQIGQVNSWNYKKETGKFNSYCGMVNGSAGEFQSPNLKPSGVVNIFAAEMCRTIPLEYTETVEVDGIKGYKYAAGLRAVDNGTLYPENKCFCGGRCVPSGVMNISSCWFDSPIFMSYPHFYKADPYYTDAVVGMQPNQKDHELYVILEPKTGLALEVAARFQVNLMIEAQPYLDLFKKAPRVFLPIMWFEERISINTEMKDDFVRLNIAIWFGLIAGAACIFIGLILLAWQRYGECLRKNLCISLKNCDLENDQIKEEESSQNIDSSETTISEKCDLKIIENETPSVMEKGKTPVEIQRLKLIYLQSNSFDSGFMNMDSCSQTSSDSNDGVTKNV